MKDTQRGAFALPSYLLLPGGAVDASSTKTTNQRGILLLMFLSWLLVVSRFWGISSLIPLVLESD